MEEEKKSISVSDYSVVFLIGPAFSGKSTFANRHFAEHEIVREGKIDYTKTLQVLDGNYLEADSRKEILRNAKAQNYQRVAILFEAELEELMARNRVRSVSRGYLEMQIRTMYTMQKRLREEGFEQIYAVSVKDADAFEVRRTKGSWDLREDKGPFDIIGDVHGCYDALSKLVRKLGYTRNEEGNYVHKEGRKIIFCGDVVDRGDQSVAVLKLIMKLEKDGVARMVMGNHDDRLLRYLKGNDLEEIHGLETTAEEMRQEDDAFREEVLHFLERQPAYLWLDGGSLVVAHAGIKRAFLGKDTKAIREYCLYGALKREYDSLGFPSIEEWAADYEDDCMAVFGHIPASRVYKIHNTYGVDTACVFGYYLSALRYPEMSVEQVKNRIRKKK